MMSKQYFKDIFDFMLKVAKDKENFNMDQYARVSNILDSLASELYKIDKENNKNV